MKTVFTVLIGLAFSLAASAQQPDPTFEWSNNMVRVINYHPNGTIAQERWFKDGKLQGEWITFDVSGKRLASRQYDDGKRTGKWLFWSENGDALREITYADGKLQEMTEWNSAITSR